MTPKISIIGIGTVGQMLAYALAIKNLGDLVLMDIKPGRAKGKALDLAQATPILGSDAKIIGTTNYADIKDSDIVFVTAGKPSEPGQSRDDLLPLNLPIIKEIGQNIAAYAPNSLIINITNPVDILTYILFKVTGFPKNRVMGMAGLLDSSRLKFCLSETLGVSFKSIEAMVLGQHGPMMVPALSKATIAGLPAEAIISSQQTENIKSKTCEAASTIINLLEYESTGFAPATAIAKMVEIILKDAKEIIPASSYLEGEYDQTGLFMGVPVVLGQTGVEKIWQLNLNDDEKLQFKKAAEHLKAIVSSLKI